MFGVSPVLQVVQAPLDQENRVCAVFLQLILLPVVQLTHPRTPIMYITGIFIIRYESLKFSILLCQYLNICLLVSTDYVYEIIVKSLKLNHCTHKRLDHCLSFVLAL